MSYNDEFWEDSVTAPSTLDKFFDEDVCMFLFSFRKVYFLLSFY